MSTAPSESESDTNLSPQRRAWAEKNLDPEAQSWTFQTFDDRKREGQAPDPKLARVLHVSRGRDAQAKFAALSLAGRA